MITKVQKSSNCDNPPIACFALSSEPPPLLTEILQITEKLHQTLVFLSDGHPVFTGKDEQGCPLQKGHEHTYIFCRADKTARIDRVILYARQGFDKRAQEVFYRLKKVWARGAPALYFTFLYTGYLKDFQNYPFFAKARAWISYTPFVPTRHPRYNRNGKPRLDPDGLHQGSPEHDLCRLLQLQDKPKPVKIECVESSREGNKSVCWQKFQIERKKGGGRRAGKRGYGFRIEFDREVQGPVAVGYGAHFGLGVFVPEGERWQSHQNFDT